MLSHSFNRIVTAIIKTEPWITFAMVLIFLIPIWSLHAFPTLDGAAHIYNSRLMVQLLAEPESWMHQFVHVNSNFSPNWITQPLIALLSLCFTPYEVEKIILTFILIGFVYGFRSLAHNLFPHQRILSLLAFAFAYNNQFILGYFNYNTGIILMMFAIVALRKYLIAPDNKSAITLLLLVVAIYFAHLIAFCLFGLITVYSLLFDYFKNQQRSTLRRSHTWLLLLPTAVVAALLLFCYFKTQSSDESFAYMSAGEIFDRIITLNGNICLEARESRFTRWIFYSLFAGLSITAFIQLYRAIKRASVISIPEQKPDMHWSYSCGLVILISLCAFLIPDGSSAGGGALTLRLITLTGMFGVLFLFSFISNKSLMLVVMVLLCIVHIDKTIFIRKLYATHQNYFRDLETASEQLNEPGLMCILDFYAKYPFNHMVKQLASNDGLLLLDAWSHKSFNEIQLNEEYMNDPQILPWVSDQWRCVPAGLENRLVKKIDWYVTIGDCAPFLSYSPICDRWQEYLQDSCSVHYQGASGIVIYRHR